MDDSKKQKIEEYEALASQIKQNIESRKRPLIVEFAGMPKSGKTTVVNSLALFLRRNGITTVVVSEKAEISPVTNKHHVDFNLWTCFTSLADIVKFRRSNEFMVIIVDRGIFDALTWFRSLYLRGKLSDEDRDAISDFLLSRRLAKDIDLIICMTTAVDTALEREFKDLLTEKTGSIMNESFLNHYTQVLGDSIEQYQDHFTRLFTIDTSQTSTIAGVEQALSTVIESLKELSDEKLTAVPILVFSKKFGFQGFDADKNKFKVLDRMVKSHGVPIYRTIAEESMDHIQIVVITLLKYKNSLAVFTKIEKSKDDRLHERQMIWIGGHLQSQDSVDDESESTLMRIMKNCLNREIEEELEQSFERPIVYKGLVYDKSDPKSLKHFGVVFQIELKSQQMVDSINNRTIMELSGQGVHVEFVNLTQDSFDEKAESLEQWSVDILGSLYDINVVNKGSRQLNFF